MNQPTRDTRSNTEIIRAAQVALAELEGLIDALRERRALGPIAFMGALEGMHDELESLAHTLSTEAEVRALRRELRETRYSLDAMRRAKCEAEA